MDKREEDKLSYKQKSTMMVLIIIMLVVIPMGYVTKVIPYTFVAMSCGHLPIESTSYSGEFMYKIPGDKGYGISMFSDYKYCTEDQAKEDGYQRSSLVNQAGV